MKAKYRLLEDKHQAGTSRGAGVRLVLTIVEPMVKVTIRKASTWPAPAQEPVEEPLNSVQYFRMPEMRNAALQEGLRQLAMGLDKQADGAVEWEQVQ